MYENAIKILEKLNNNGFEAYIVGGYPRDRYLGIESTDIDICTSATPGDIVRIFSKVDMSNASYGKVCLLYNGFSYEITTFRRDKSMLDGNRSYSVEYVGSLEEDLFRRDFIMNTLCINKDGEYVDYFGAIEDIDARIIRTVKAPSISFKEDPLRVLRAIRFSTKLSFSLSNEICSVIPDVKHLLSNLSFYRCKKELDLIFSSKNNMFGIRCLKKFGMDEVLMIDLDKVVYCSDYLGIWAQCTFDKAYPFTNKEKKVIDKIRLVLSLTPSFSVLYEYGMDICKLVDEIRGTLIYDNLNKKIPIHNRDEIDIDKDFLLLNIPHHLISSMYKKIEHEILCGNLINNKKQIQYYILENI